MKTDTLETSKSTEYITSKIQSITYRLSPSGVLIALVTLEDLDVFDSLNTFLFDNALEIKEMCLSVGVSVSVDLDGGQNGVMEPLGNNSAITLPSTCPSCTCDLIDFYKNDDNGDKIYAGKRCENNHCVGQSMSPIRKILELSAKEEDVYMVSKFVEEYVYRNEKVSLDNITDFNLLWFDAKAKDTRTRLNSWKAVHKYVDGEVLFRLDSNLEAYLTSNETKCSDFWFVANLPISEKSLKILKDLNPANVVNGTEELISKLPDSKVLLDNLDYIVLLLEIFNKKAVKTWI